MKQKIFTKNNDHVGYYDLESNKFIFKIGYKLTNESYSKLMKRYENKNTRKNVITAYNLYERSIMNNKIKNNTIIDTIETSVSTAAVLALGRPSRGYEGDFQIKNENDKLVSMPSFSYYKTLRESLNFVETKHLHVIKYCKNQNNKSDDRTINRILYENINDKKKQNGKKAEEYVVKLEKEKLNFLKYYDLAKKVRILETDGDGYDIISYNEKREEIHIEVKSSSSKNGKTFYITKNELKHSFDNNHFIYFLQSLNENDYNKYEINPKELNPDDLEPVCFRVNLST